MSNRRRLPSEKARRPRCIRCKGREFVHKVWANGDRTPVCESCGHVGSTQHARDLPPTTPTDERTDDE